MTMWITEQTRTLPELHAAAANAAKRLREIHDAAVSTVRELHDANRTIKSRWDLSDDRRTAGIRLARTAARDRLDALELERLTAEADVRSYLARATSAQHDGGDAARESQRSAAWQRARAQLDALPQSAAKSIAAAKLLDDASRIGDLATLEAARRELPAYLSVHNEPMPDGLARDLDIVAGPQITKDARTFEAALGYGPENTATALGSLRAYVDNPDQTARAVVASWDGEVVNLADET